MNMRSQIMIWIKIKLVRKRFMRMPQIQNSQARWVKFKKKFEYLGHDEVDDKWNWTRQNFQNPFFMLFAG